MKLLIPLLLSVAVTVPAQETPDDPGGAPLERWPAISVEPESLPRDSLARQLARIEIARAEAAVRASDFWHRLIPRMQVSASLGAREALFPDPAGGYFFPKDSYRLTVSFALSEVFDASGHARALLQLEEACTRYALLLSRQSEVRLAQVRKRIALTRELALVREQAELTRLLLEYEELLFRQGKTEFRTLTRARLEAVKRKADLLDLEGRVREFGSTSP